MPNRYLREAILDSEGVNALTPEAEVFYRRLMSVVDDYGRFDGRITVLRSRLYPLQLDKVREASVERCLAECEAARLVRLYVAGGKPYLVLFNLGVKPRSDSRWPNPPDEPDACAHLPAPARNCPQLRPYSGSDAITNARARSDAGTPARARETWQQHPEIAELFRQALADAGVHDADYLDWGTQLAVLLGWTTPKQLASVVAWYSGFRSRKVTPAERDAVLADFAARTEPLKWANEVLPAINAAIRRHRSEAAKLAAATAARDEPISDEERQKVRQLAQRAKEKIGRMIPAH